MIIPRRAVNCTIQTHSKKWATMSCTTTGILKATASCHTYENGFVFRCCISNFNHYHVVMTCLTLLLGKGQLNYGGLSWSKKCPWQVISLFILVFNNDTLLSFEYVVIHVTFMFVSFKIKNDSSALKYFKCKYFWWTMSK